MRQGDIWIVDLEPTVGREQKSKRPVLVISPTTFNKHNLPIVCCITSGGVSSRDAGLTVSLATAGTQVVGVVLCQHVRTLDIKARAGRLIEHAPKFIVDEVLSCLQDILEG
jgi:mRNA interferase ChpB